MPEAPLHRAGPAKVTVAPETGLPYGSVTLATSGAAKAVLTPALCGDPEAR